MYRWKHVLCHQGPVSISYQTSYCKITCSLEAAIFASRLSDRYDMCQTPQQISKRCNTKLPISQLRYFARSYDNTSYRILNRGADQHIKTGSRRYPCVNCFIIHSCNHLLLMWCQTITWINDDLSFINVIICMLLNATFPVGGELTHHINWLITEYLDNKQIK